MPSCRSTSNQNTRVFAPHVVLKQDTTRLAVILKSGEGYTLQAGLTAGDVIRYDPLDQTYKKSIADTETNAEVLGVIENGITSPYEVVLYGSIKYPTERLNKIVEGSDGGVDILFLDNIISGGLTGTIDLSGGPKIVKPVVQVAPHGIFNGIVTNYIGYKTGSAPSVGEMPSAPDSSVLFGPSGIGNKYWLDLSEDQLISTSDYPGVYEIYGTEYGPYRELVVINSGTITSGLVGKEAYHLINGVKNSTGVIIEVDIANSTVLVEKKESISLYDTSKSLYINGIGFGFSSSYVKSFFVPKVSGSISQSGETLTPYLKLYDDPRSVSIPNELTVNQLVAETSLTVNSVDVGAKLAELETKINSLNSRVNAF